jgi:cytochrome c-type biogenesis protein CcmF
MNGQSLNPLLQDPGLAIHPPMLYMGYVGFSVAFAFALAALIGGRLDASWARWSRPWTLAAWCFLTFGIVLGSWWSYRVLGWGGWWFWDPVENASFLPWLTGTALVHSLIVTEKRGAFKSWTALLAICAFALSLLGTFLVRSGILVSVHAFAVDPARGAYMLKFLFSIVGASLLIYAWRANKIKGRGNFALLSRETLLLTNNVILMTAMATVLLGTIYPLILQSLHLGKISVGPPYFNAVFIPLMAPLLFLMAIGPQAGWQQMPKKDLLEKFWVAFAVSIVSGLALAYLFTGQKSLAAAIGLTLSLWIIIATLQGSFRLHKKIGRKKVTLSHYGMVIAHIGMAIVVIGITLTSIYSVEKDVRLAPGQSTSIHDYKFTFANIAPLTGPNYTGFITQFNIRKDNKEVAVVHPEKRLFTVQQEGISNPGISGGVFLDFYVALGEKMTNNSLDDSWAVRIYYKPFIRWIWAGGILMMLGGIASVFDKRYRRKKEIRERSGRK